MTVSVYVVGCLNKIAAGCLEYIRDVLLRVSVEDWKPATLNLDHDLMPFFEYVVHFVQAKRIFFHFTGRRWYGRSEAFSKPAPENIRRNTIPTVAPKSTCNHFEKGRKGLVAFELSGFVTSSLAI